MQNPFQTAEKAKSIAEHVSIIRIYQQTGLLDKAKAIEVYRKFNYKHQDYYAAMNATAIITNSRIQIDSSDNKNLVDNLISQALWAVGKEVLASMGVII
jgi:hypothetical protein